MDPLATIESSAREPTGNKTARDMRLASGAAAVLIATVLAYTPALRSGYIWDDDDYVTQNRIVQSWTGLPRIWLTTETPQYYPLVFTTFWIEHKLWGLHPLGYHVVNVLLHLANALLVWRIARALRIPAAAFIGAVFALHPVHVESVAWITERKNVLSGLFYLLALWSYLRFDDTGRRRFYGASAAAFVGALLSKTVTATLPVVLLIALFQRRKRLARADVLRVAPLLVIGAALGLWTAYLERFKVGAEGAEWSHTLLERAAILAPSAFCFYASKVIWPHPLIFVYPRWEYDAGQWTWYVPLIGVLLALTVFVALRRRLGWGPVLLLAFSGVTLFPALGFLNVYPHRYSFVADHFQYLGSLGFIVLYTSLGAWVGQRWVSPSRPRASAAAVALGVTLVLGILSYRQSTTYKDEVRLWERTSEANPDAWIALVNLGSLYVAQGRDLEALELFERATRYPIARPEAYGNWGNTLSRLGHYEEGIEKLRKVIDLRPRDALAYSNLGASLRMAGQLEEALAAARKAVELAPRQPLAWGNLSDAYAARGDWPEAARCAERSLELEPNQPKIRALYAQTLLKLARHSEALRQYEHLRQEDPARPEPLAGLARALTAAGAYAEALATCADGLRRCPDDPGLLTALAWLLATCPDDTIRDGSRARRTADQLHRVVGPAAPVEVLDTLAAVAAEIGNFNTAAILADKALQGARLLNDADWAAEIEQRLAGYHARRPHRLVKP